MEYEWLNNEKYGQGTHCTKMGADNSAKNTPNVPQNLSAKFVCPRPKVMDFKEKKANIGRLKSPVPAITHCSELDSGGKFLILSSDYICRALV